MDDAARLVSELHDKLAELDGKVAAYQRDMLAEFHKHMEACLKDLPENVSNEVSRVIAESMSRYPSLSPTTRDALDSPVVDHNKSWKGRKSPPPVLPHTSGVPKEVTRDPHYREKEFQGLFTPTYLPLLENRDRIPNPVPTPISEPSTPTIPTIPTTPTTPTPTVPESGMQSAPLSVDNVKKVEDSRKREISEDGRPVPVRRLTDKSTSSVDSTSSDSKVRRSALRRASTGSSHKGSPRRVRFEFAGQEVLPSSSPKGGSTLTLATRAEMLPEPASAIAIENDSPETYTTTSLLDVEGEEDSLPRPKKVSSTQALQALTRSPLEAGSTWTVVNPDPEEPPIKMNGVNGEFNKVDSQITIRAADDVPGWVSQKKVVTPSVQLVRRTVDDDDDDDDDESEDDWLSMRPKKSSSIISAKQSFGGLPSPATSTAISKVNGKKHVPEDEDPLFDMEDEEGGSRPPLASKYLPEDDDDDDSGDAPIEFPRKQTKFLPKAIRTATASDADRIKQQDKILSPMSPSSVLFGHTMGSYNGAAIQSNPINNHKLYDEIAGMKDVHFFVGSVDGRSGVEAADMGSYRAMAKSFSTEPRSFTERLAMEEAMERNRRGRDIDDE
ncbi:hypothetical protein QBC38DRAFT_353186 [Podospora fimiseda]|uniref:Uncharacterized protein n=1 Tax=Podospora fimiseda TaxID=252190 RepID=A0AAN7H2A1_9PEZI|nr:hypothetical protein QBC38DRAFT_353186 [Podospora fimiseda]